MSNNSLKPESLPTEPAPSQPRPAKDSKATGGRWQLVLMSGLVVGIVMAIGRAHMTGVAWLLPTGLAYAICVINPNLRFSWLEKGITTVIALVIGTYGQQIFSWWASLYKRP